MSHSKTDLSTCPLKIRRLKIKSHETRKGINRKGGKACHMILNFLKVYKIDSILK